MIEKFYPSEYIDNVFSIDYKKLYNKGYRGIIFDIDNTLVHHGDNSTKEVDELFKEILRIGIKTLLLTNNTKERVENFNKNIKSPYICDAEKPNPKNFLKAVELLEINKDEAVCIGDQIFTDIYGANQCGISSILIKYICHDDKAKIGIKRNIEKIILFFYRLKKSHKNRIGDIITEDEF